MREFLRGAPRGDRTPDLVVRSHALYPTELGAPTNDRNVRCLTACVNRGNLLPALLKEGAWQTSPRRIRGAHSSRCTNDAFKDAELELMHFRIIVFPSTGGSDSRTR